MLEHNCPPLRGSPGVSYQEVDINMDKKSWLEAFRCSISWPYPVLQKSHDMILRCQHACNAGVVSVLLISVIANVGHGPYQGLSEDKTKRRYPALKALAALSSFIESFTQEMEHN